MPSVQAVNQAIGRKGGRHWSNWVRLPTRNVIVSLGSMSLNDVQSRGQDDRLVLKWFERMRRLLRIDPLERQHLR